MSTVFAALMCHAPVVVPAVGGSESRACSGTTRAMREIAQRAVRARPDRLVVVSPHSPRSTRGFGAWRGDHRGDLEAFGAPEVRVDLPDAREVSECLPEVGGEPLDHGAVVPLLFLWEAGWRGETAIVSLPAQDGRDGVGSLGDHLAALPGRTAVIAAGDMGRRLRPGPGAHEFAERFVAALAADNWAAATAVDRREAAADVVESAVVAMAAAGRPLNAEVLQYEAPWGVGYTEAVLHDVEPPLYAMARACVRNALLGRPLPRFEGGPEACGVYVSMHLGAELMGSGGSLVATRSRLYDEVVFSALSALHDGRMLPPTLEQLSMIRFEVSLIRQPEQVSGAEDLDPSRFGLALTDGVRRSVLLPGLGGIRTAADQIQACRRKAGIRQGDPVQLQRFTIEADASP